MMIKRIPYLITRFWTGKATTEQREELLDALQEPDQAWKDSLKADFDKDQEGEVKLSAQRAEKLLQEIHAQLTVPQTTKRPVIHFIRWAAAAVVLFGFGFLILQQQSQQPETIQQEQVVSHSIRTNKDTLVHLLPDQSTVTLYPHSVLVYNETYGKSDRDLSLKGYAKFKVTHNKALPFIVEANGYTTTALGTEFTVNAAYTSEMQVHLLSGKVVVKSTTSSQYAVQDIFLKPGQILVVDAAQRTAKVSSAELTEKSLLAQRPVHAPKETKALENVDPQVLHFDKTPLLTVFAKIQAFYGVQIQLDNVNLDGKSFTGNFTKDDDVALSLQTICDMNNLRLQRDGQYFILQNIPQ